MNIERDEDGMFIARCPAPPGCISEGKARKEALAIIKDVIEGYIASEESARLSVSTSSTPAVFHPGLANPSNPVEVLLLER